ncbi:hypothetical protein AYO22_08068 [Fonsecaea multimorphosa]|nr:hypothetical protein AYO22_08068 [Fonsecaea multimorphosa]
MEAIAALSLACNIIQVIDSTSKAVKACGQFYKYGTTVDIEDLSYSLPPGTQLSKTDAALVELGKRVHDLAESLSKELNSLKIAPGLGRRAALVKTFHLKWRASRIDELKRKLDGLVQVLDNKILVQLSEKLSLTLRNQGDILKALNDRQKEIAQQIIEGATTVEKLVSSQGAQARSHVTQEHLVTRSRIDQIDKKIDQVVDTQLQKVEFDKFMQSLHFPGINWRQDTIEEAHEKTFEWIFESLEDTPERWHNFPSWLRSDQPLYWILGKPGSGKSTLMNFLVQDSRTLKELGSSGQPTTILSFFFWEAGVELQKALVGLLRSLIYQLLRAIDSNQALQVWSDVIQPHNPPLLTVWTSKLLLRLLQMIVQAVDQRFCFFLDGLDEFQDAVDGTEAIRALQDVLNYQNSIKLCISSRPQNNLQVLYQGCPNLVIQTLTEHDIRRYVEDKLLKTPLTDQLGAAHSTQASRLVDEVVWKAEGVFLWVTLAVQSLLRGIRNEDHWETLQERLDQLPSEISDLYKHMWKRMADDYPIYAKEAALYLQIIQHFGPQNLLEMTIMVDEDLRPIFSTPAATWGVKQLEAKVDHEKVRKRVTVCCAGFLEVTDVQLYNLDSELRKVQKRLEYSTLELRPEVIDHLLECFRAHTSTKVDFVHRTAAEFLNTSDGHALLQAQLYTKEELVVQLLRSNLISVFLAPPLYALWLPLEFWAAYLPHLESEEASTEFYSEAEVICRKLFALDLWDLKSVESDLIVRGQSDEVDYIKLFRDFSTPRYLMNRLNEKGVAENKAYLTELLSWWVEGAFICWYLPRVIQCGVLLLQLGADPNQVLWPGISDHQAFTIWTNALIWPSLWLRAETPSELEKGSYVDLITAMLEAGADPNESHDCCFARDSEEDGWRSSSEATLSTAFMLSKFSALDLVTGSGHVLAERIESLLRGAGAASARKQVLCFQPPMSWWVSTKHSSNPPFFHAYVTTASWIRMQPSIKRKGLDYFRALHQDDSHVFNNGLDALHAAGWTDEEMRTTRSLQRLWEELQQSGDEGQDGHEQHSTEGEDVEN